MPSEEVLKAVKQYDEYVKVCGITEEVCEAYSIAVHKALKVEREVEYGLKLSKRVKAIIEKYIIEQTKGSIRALEQYAKDNNSSFKILDIYYSILLAESFDNFESYIMYMESKRPFEKKFYEPRKGTLGVVVDDLQDLEDDKLDFYGLSLPSRTGKSTICIFFLSWIALRKPNSHSAMGGHSGMLAKGFYGELLNLFETEEYMFSEIYTFWHYEHEVKYIVQRKSADEFTINLDRPDRFATITCRGIDGTWTGAIDISKDGYLYVDDLVRDRTHSLSPKRMEDTWQEYLNKMVDRKNDGAKELMVGTLWSVLDPLSKMNQKYGDNPRYRFRKIPALNERDESNFNYLVNGFSTDYYKKMRDRLDNAEWMAKFQQAPYIREGLLFNADELRYFNGILPEGDSRVVAVCDVAWGGGDSLSMPIGREYENGDVYIFDWIFNRGAKEETCPLVVGKIIENEIRQCRFEGNVGGAMYSDYVKERLDEKNYKCSCTEKKAPNKMSKLEKIMAYSGDILRKFVFISPTASVNSMEQKNGIKQYKRSTEYQKAMEELCMFVTVGKNEHDDAADSLTQLCMFVQGDKTQSTMIMKSPI